MVTHSALVTQASVAADRARFLSPERWTVSDAIGLLDQISTEHGVTFEPAIAHDLVQLTNGYILTFDFKHCIVCCAFHAHAYTVQQHPCALT